MPNPNDPALRLSSELARRGLSPRHTAQLALNAEAMDQLAEFIRQLFTTVLSKDVPQWTIAFEDVAIDDTTLERRIRNSLASRGITSLGVLALLSREYVYTFPNVGHHAIARLEAELKRHNLEFRDEVLETVAQKAARYETLSSYVADYLSDNPL